MGWKMWESFFWTPLTSFTLNPIDAQEPMLANHSSHQDFWRCSTISNYLELKKNNFSSMLRQLSELKSELSCRWKNEIIFWHRKQKHFLAQSTWPEGCWCQCKSSLFLIWIWSGEWKVHEKYNCMQVTRKLESILWAAKSKRRSRRLLLQVKTKFGSNQFCEQPKQKQKLPPERAADTLCAGDTWLAISKVLKNYNLEKICGKV